MSDVSCHPHIAESASAKGARADNGARACARVQVRDSGLGPLISVGYDDAQRRFRQRISGALDANSDVLFSEKNVI